MTLRPYKFQVVAVCQETGEDGDVTGEKIVGAQGGGPIEVFGLDGLHEFADSFSKRLEEVEG